jgi:predicted anti-sigma-YlaC factor YlaD
MTDSRSDPTSGRDPSSGRAPTFQTNPTSRTGPTRPPICVAAHDLVSARTDDFGGDGSEQELPFSIADLDAHASTCPDCRRFQAQIVALRGVVRRLTPSPTVDVSAAVMRSIRMNNRMNTRMNIRTGSVRENHRGARPAIGPSVTIGLLITAFAQLLGALPHLFAVTGGASGHLSSDTAAFEIALAAGFVYAAVRPVAVGGVRLLTTVLACLSVFVAAVGAAKSTIAFPLETHHVIAIFGTVLLWLLPRTAEGFRWKSPFNGERRRTFV